MPDIPTQYFLKELPDQPLYLPSGQQVPWEHVDGDIGILQTTDVGLIFQLSNAASAHRGGVIKIDEAQYQELLKKKLTEQPPSTPHDRYSLPQIPIRTAGLPQVGALNESPSGNVAASPEPAPPPPVETLAQKEPQPPPREMVKRGKAKPA